MLFWYKYLFLCLYIDFSFSYAMSTFCECGEAFFALSNRPYMYYIFNTANSPAVALQNKSSHSLWWISVRRGTSHVQTISFCLSGTTDLFPKVLSRLFRTESRHALCETGRPGKLVPFSCGEVSNYLVLNPFYLGLSPPPHPPTPHPHPTPPTPACVCVCVCYNLKQVFETPREAKQYCGGQTRRIPAGGSSPECVLDAGEQIASATASVTCSLGLTWYITVCVVLHVIIPE